LRGNANKCPVFALPRGQFCRRRRLTLLCFCGSAAGPAGAPGKRAPYYFHRLSRSFLAQTKYESKLRHCLFLILAEVQ